MRASPLAELRKLRLAFSAAAAARKLTLLDTLAGTRLASARQVLQLHEALCFMRAYPDSAELLAVVEHLLASFARRPDLRAHRAAQVNSGIAGTAIHDRFFAGPAQWLAERWPAQLRLDRSHAEAEPRIARALPLLVTHAEAQALIELKLPGHAALDRLRDAGTTDATFLVRRMAALAGDGFTREAFADAIDASYVLQTGDTTPSRTAARFSAAAVTFQRRPLAHARADLRAAMGQPPRAMRRLPPALAAEAIELARASTVTRARALEAFSHADARDAWFVDDGQGLAFTLTGVVPERRQVLAAVYGGLTLRNGVPIGYLQADVVGRSAALSFNTFDTFRGGEAAHTFARLLAALRRALGVTSFSIEPYQLGKDNKEGLESGAWWFYAKLGFAARDAATLKLARAEQARVRRDPSHRSSAATLLRLARQHLFFDLDPAHPHAMQPQVALGLRAAALLSQRAGADRERALDELSGEAMRHLGLDSLRGFSADERQAWRRWCPLVGLLDLAAWSDAQRQALVAVIRAKAARSERTFIERYAAHPRLDAALQAAAGR